MKNFLFITLFGCTLIACNQQTKKVEVKQPTPISNKIWGITLGCDTTNVFAMMAKKYPSATYELYYPSMQDSTFLISFSNDEEGFIFAGLEWDYVNFSFLSDGKIFDIRFSKYGDIRKYEYDKVNYSEPVGPVGLEEYDSLSKKLENKYPSFKKGVKKDGLGSYTLTFEDKNTRVVVDAYATPSYLVQDENDFARKSLTIDYIDKTSPYISKKDAQERQEEAKRQREAIKAQKEEQQKEKQKQDRKKNAYSDL